MQYRKLTNIDNYCQLLTNIIQTFTENATSWQNWPCFFKACLKKKKKKVLMDAASRTWGYQYCLFIWIMIWISIYILISIWILIFISLFILISRILLIILPSWCPIGINRNNLRFQVKVHRFLIDFRLFTISMIHWIFLFRRTFAAARMSLIWLPLRRACHWV